MLRLEHTRCALAAAFRRPPELLHLEHNRCSQRAAFGTGYASRSLDLAPEFLHLRHTDGAPAATFRVAAEILHLKLNGCGQSAKVRHPHTPPSLAPETLHLRHTDCAPSAKVRRPSQLLQLQHNRCVFNAVFEGATEGRQGARKAAPARRPPTARGEDPRRRRCGPTARC